MKTKPSLILSAALGAAILAFSACSKNDSVAQAADSTKAAAKDIATAVKDTASDTWEAIKDFTHEKRADFADRMDRMADKRDAELAALNAKFTGLPDAAAKQRDSANKEYAEARASLKAELKLVREGTAENWAVAKEKSAQAWQRVQAAYEKIKDSATS